MYLLHQSGQKDMDTNYKQQLKSFNTNYKNQTTLEHGLGKQCGPTSQPGLQQGQLVWKGASSYGKYSWSVGRSKYEFLCCHEIRSLLVFHGS